MSGESKQTADVCATLSRIRHVGPLLHEPWVATHVSDELSMQGCNWINWTLIERGPKSKLSPTTWHLPRPANSRCSKNTHIRTCLMWRSQMRNCLLKHGDSGIRVFWYSCSKSPAGAALSMWPGVGGIGAWQLALGKHSNRLDGALIKKANAKPQSTEPRSPFSAIELQCKQGQSQVKSSWVKLSSCLSKPKNKYHRQAKVVGLGNGNI